MDPLKQDILRGLGLHLLPPEEQEKAFARIGAILFQKVMLRVADLLGDKDQADLDQLIASNPENGGAIFEFLRKRVPDFESIVKEEAASFRDDALGVMDQIK